MEFYQIVSVATLASILGYMSKSLLEKIMEKDNNRISIVMENEIEYRKKQLEELYGPLYSVLKTNRTIYKLWDNKLFNEINGEIKKHFEKCNNQMIEIIQSKIHLIEGDKMPMEMIQFITSAKVWNLYCANSDRDEYPDDLKKIDEIKWPYEFEEYVFSETETLKKELDRLYKDYSVRRKI